MKKRLSFHLNSTYDSVIALAQQNKTVMNNIRAFRILTFTFYVLWAIVWKPSHIIVNKWLIFFSFVPYFVVRNDWFKQQNYETRRKIAVILQKHSTIHFANTHVHITVLIQHMLKLNNNYFWLFIIIGILYLFWLFACTYYHTLHT